MYSGDEFYDDTITSGEWQDEDDQYLDDEQDDVTSGFQDYQYPTDCGIGKTPITRQPSLEMLEMSSDEGFCQATDGCVVEPDGECEHGHISWLVYLGMI